MDKLELKKNCLDLAYKRNLYLLNALLIIGVGSIITFFAGLILNLDKWFNYSVVLVIIFSLTYVGYIKVDNSLKSISEAIIKLK